jgi:hypothetical protein
MNTLKAPEGSLSFMSARRVVSAIGAAFGLILMPKCPLCVAAYLVSFGVGASAAHAVAPLIRPAAWLLMAAAALALVASLRRILATRFGSGRPSATQGEGIIAAGSGVDAEARCCSAARRRNAEAERQPRQELLRSADMIWLNQNK